MCYIFYAMGSKQLALCPSNGAYKQNNCVQGAI